MRALQKLESCFFPELKDLIVSEDCRHIFLVMELETTDIRTLLHNGGKIEFEEDHLKHIMYNLLCAVHFMDSANIIHRDLKPANILMNDQCQVKICDFGMARTMPEHLSRFTHRLRKEAKTSVKLSNLKRAKTDAFYVS